ncbi:MAG: hypothetical protein EOM25_15240, partial [Deltaproteobacteria bacterium]|nr:hypothetical protein [Deltaproteobacteria bacterium]
MDRIQLNLDDYFFIVRSLVFAEIKKLRKTSDVFGDELQLSPESTLGQDPLAFSQDELTLVTGRVAGFFGLPSEKSSELAGLDSLGQWADFLLREIGSRPEVITFFTSGSTGEPKPILREYYFLEQDALHLADMLRGSKRVIGLVPPHHIYGFIYTILIPKVLGAGLEDYRFKRPSTIVKQSRAGDCIVGFPHLWRLCSETRERFPAGVIGTTSTGPCPADIIRSLKRQGLGMMVEIYGSSESG